MTRKIFFIPLLMLTCGQAAVGDVFKWTDEAGNTHYGNSEPRAVDFEIIDVYDCTDESCLQAEEELARQADQETADIEAWLDQRRPNRATPPRRPPELHRRLTVNP